MMKALLKPLVFAVVALGTMPVMAQSGEEAVDDSQHAERRARIQELRSLLLEERESRRQDIQQRLENLSEDEKAALQERRRLMRQSQAQRQNRLRRSQSQPCVCPDSATETEE